MESGIGLHPFPQFGALVVRLDAPQIIVEEVEEEAEEAEEAAEGEAAEEGEATEEPAEE